jgi:hypothetical protein
VLTLSNIYTIDKVEDFKAKVRRRPIKTSTYRHIIRQVFQGQNTKELMIPCFINNYNHYIRGVDLANQFREAYKTHKPILRN